jgi:uncharacterized protein (DUF427 family)
VRIVHAGITIVDSTTACRVLETSHPPGIYVPPADVRMDLLSPTPTSTWCEYKGRAAYWLLRVDDTVVRDAAWSYPDPTPGYEPIRDHLSFYPGRVDACFLDDEQVVAQEGGFYGGWITSDVVGPFKGAAGTLGW